MLVVVNPAAQNGTGAQAAAWLRAQVEREGSANRVRIVETERAGHATEIARSARDMDALVVCGGDGVLHESLQGLMSLPREERPALGVLPCGNGNDFARTVRMPRTGVAEAWQALARAKRVSFDVGSCNGEYFLQTLSFGVDAAIALGTQERRHRSGHQGTRLFLEEGVHQLLRHRDVRACTIELCDEGGAVVRTIREHVHLLAVQIGPTYGGGFVVCPDAAPTDGAFDVCACRAPLGFVRASALFMLAKGGHHTGFQREFLFLRSPALRISFESEPPVQIDGEVPTWADDEHVAVFRYDIRTLFASMDVLAG